MWKNISLLFLVCWPIVIFSQNEKTNVNLDQKYLEDQFYLGVNYNFMLNYPADVLKRNFSYGLQAGFIKDIPLNGKRNVALGIGMGYAVNSYYSNLVSTNDTNEVTYSVNTIDFNRSKFETHSIEVPLEIRWRNSSPSEYKFLRVYTGFKLGYNFSARSKLVTDIDRLRFANIDIQKLQYGLMLNFGYNTFNLHVYYSLNNFLKDNITLDTGEAIEIKPLRVGLIFYIL